MKRNTIEIKDGERAAAIHKTGERITICIREDGAVVYRRSVDSPHVINTVLLDWGFTFRLGV